MRATIFLVTLIVSSALADVPRAEWITLFDVLIGVFLALLDLSNDGSKDRNDRKADSK